MSGANQLEFLHPIVVMGVSGTGKTVVGSLLAEHIGAIFVDADDLHPERNRSRMHAGVPLDDDDRAPWLDTVGHRIGMEGTAGGEPHKGRIVVACSALKRAYRERITTAAGRPVLFVHLTGDPEVIAARMRSRVDHFMPPSLLATQLDALDVPGHQVGGSRLIGGWPPSAEWRRSVL